MKAKRKNYTKYAAKNNNNFRIAFSHYVQIKSLMQQDFNKNISTRKASIKQKKKIKIIETFA
ncbi:MAG: hypothetical protein O7C59_02520 [Rickettsia endosymbiont of Ixodes persulcatus]|nr:hypothetical protein [Rickettsia endosymbiont of Ixodes persulcatus]